MKEFLLNNIYYIFSFLIIWLAILTFLLVKILIIWRQIFTKGDKKNLDEVLKSQLEDIEDIHKALEDAFEKIKKLKLITDKTIQKVGIIRFNPFQDMGSDQSFSIALLDSKNNGLVLTSLTSRSGTRVYSKAIENGESKYQLINEEIEVIKKADDFSAHIKNFWIRHDTNIEIHPHANLIKIGVGMHPNDMNNSFV